MIDPDQYRFKSCTVNFRERFQNSDFIAVFKPQGNNFLKEFIH